MEFVLLLPAAAVVWKLYQLTRAPHDAPLRAVVLCLLCAGLSYPLAMNRFATAVDTMAGYGAAKLTQNVLLLLMVYFLMCFYLYSADGEAGRCRARREAVVVAVVAVAITVAAETVSHPALAGSFITADMTIAQVAFFYGGAGLYLMYALGMAAHWTRQYACMSRRPHATGLWIAAIGLGAMAMGCAIRAVIVAIRWSGGSVPRPIMSGVAGLVLLSILLFLAGVTYSGARARIASARLWLRHRRDHRRLSPLWELLAQAYPENVLRPASASVPDRWRARGVHRRYHRRIVECRDGLVDISPYLACSGDGNAVLELAPAELAARLRQAVAEIGQGDPAPRQAVPLAMALGGDRRSDVQQLIAVSDALRTAT